MISKISFNGKISPRKNISPKTFVNSSIGLLSAPIIDSYTKLREDNNVKKVTQEDINIKIKELCTSDSIDTKYDTVTEEIDSDNITCKYFKYYDSNKVLRKKERVSNEGTLIDSEIYNENGNIIKSSEVVFTIANTIKIYNAIYDGSTKENILQTTNLTLDLKDLSIIEG